MQGDCGLPVSDEFLVQAVHGLDVFLRDLKKPYIGVLDQAFAMRTLGKRKKAVLQAPPRYSMSARDQLPVVVQTLERLT